MALRRLSQAFAVGLALLTGSAAHSQAPASKPLRIVMPLSAGGPAEATIRMVSDKLQASLARPILIEARPGADGVIGAMEVIKSAPDGSTLLYAPSGLVTINQFIKKNLPYDPFRDFALVSTFAYYDVALVVGSGVPAQDLKEFLAYAKRPGPAPALASGGNGTSTHLYVELLRDHSGIDFLHVPFKGISPAVTAVMGEQLAGTFVGLSAVLPQIRSGKMKALGIIGDQRSPLTPQVPTFAEQGAAALDILLWNGFVGPRDTPVAFAEAFTAALRQAVETEDVKAKFRAGGIHAWVLGGKEFERMARAESGRWQRLIAARNITE